MRWMLATLLLITVFALPVAAQAPEAGKNQIVTTGSGTVEVMPDQATVSVGVQAQRRTAAEAIDEANRIATQILERLQKLEVRRAQMRTSGVQVHPVFSRPRDDAPPQISGYRAVYTLTVTLTDLARVGRVIDESIAGGANVIVGVSFGLRDPGRARAQALAAAYREAREKADALAQAARLRITGIERITEGGVQFRLPQVQVDRAMPAAPVPTPVEPGTVSVSAQVTVVFTY
ncbi:MAG: SIMPL domain-containing protein [Armatimonadetes bacterium]|nr:SIMPL domain-containing protein [Armatimonadota bacterium]